MCKKHFPVDRVTEIVMGPAATSAHVYYERGEGPIFHMNFEDPSELLLKLGEAVSDQTLVKFIDYDRQIRSEITIKDIRDRSQSPAVISISGARQALK